MAIPSRQIGWSTKANLLWQISKQLEYLTCVAAGGCGTTTTTSTIAPTTTTTTTTLIYFSWLLAGSNISSEDACNGGSGLVNIYSATSILANGTFLYTDTELTIPAPNLWYSNPLDNIVYTIDGGFGDGYIFSQTFCPTTTTTTTAL